MPRAKTTSAKAFAPRQGPAPLRHALLNEMPEIFMLNLVYENEIYN
jgi:hypothetical protein